MLIYGDRQAAPDPGKERWMMSLNRRLTAITIVFLIIFGVATGLAISTMLRVRTPVEELGISLARSVEGNEHFLSALNRADSEARIYVLTGDEDEREEALELLEEAGDELATLRAIQPPASLTPDQVVARAQVLEDQQLLLDWVTPQLIAIMDAREAGEDVDDLLEEIEANEEQYAALRERADALLNAEITATTADTDQLLSRAAAGVIAALVLVLVLVGSLLYGMRR